MKVICQICQEKIGDTHLRDIKHPMTGAMFTSLDPVRGWPAPFDQNAEWDWMVCPHGLHRPFLEENKVLTDEGIVVLPLDGGPAYIDAKLATDLDSMARESLGLSSCVQEELAETDNTYPWSVCLHNARLTFDGFCSVLRHAPFECRERCTNAELATVLSIYDDLPEDMRMANMARGNVELGPVRNISNQTAEGEESKQSPFSGSLAFSRSDGNPPDILVLKTDIFAKRVRDTTKKQGAFICPQCGKQKDSPTKLKQHITMAHKKE